MAFYITQLHVSFWLCILLLIVDAKAKCLQPSIRREWRTLSEEERAEWIDAVRCLNKLPHDPALTPTVDPSLSLIPPVNTSSSFWDDISYLHMDLNILIHFTGFFLPWHRAFVWGMENALKEKCNYKGVQPYWDWTQDASDFYHATIFDDDPESGFGGWGDPANDYQISTGGFAKDFIVSYPVPHSVRRNFTIQPLLGSTAANADLYINTTFTKANADYLVNSFVGDFEGFHAYLESIQGLHPGPHLITGGDMAGLCPSTAPASCIAGPKWTPNDPLFFMHHAMVDKLWYDWQSKDESSLYSYHGGSVSTFNNSVLYPVFPNGAPPFLNFSSVIPNDGMLFPNWTIWDVMDTRSGPFCYIYQ